MSNDMKTTDSAAGADSLNRIVRALRVLGIDGDTIFRRIRDDLERGLAKEARSHLNFVDDLLRQL